MFIAITHYKILDYDDITHFKAISPYIDHLLLRTPMSEADLSSFLALLFQTGFPKEKIIIHSSIELLEAFNLKSIHFREKDFQGFKYKHDHPEISVSMSAHSIDSIKKAESHQLDFVLFGHVFESDSKKALTPRTHEEKIEATYFNIPVVALGGINLETVRDLPPGFSGIAAISAFMDATANQIILLRKEWKTLNSTL